MKLTELIEDYFKTFSTKSVQGHFQALNDIGEEFDRIGPNDITQADLKKLEKILVKVRTIMKEKKYKSDQIKTINQLIAKVATLANKNPKSRSEKMNLELTELGSKLIDLASLLHSLPVVIFLQNIIEHISKN